MVTSTEPYLSIVTFSRNDDYAGGALQKLQFCYDILFEQLETYKLTSEVILVDWNGPKNKLPLKEAIQWPSNLHYCSIRVIEVPYEIHASYKHSEISPVNPAVAYNVGLRHARGAYSLCRAGDAIYSDELVEFLASKPLQAGRLYRCMRNDVSKPDFKLKNRTEILLFCDNNIVISNRNLEAESGLPDLFTNASGDFQLMATKHHHHLRGYLETEDVLSLDVDGIYEFCAYAYGLKETLLEGDCKLYKIAHSATTYLRVSTKKYPYEEVVRAVLPNYVRRYLGKIRRVLAPPKRIMKGQEMHPYEDYVKLVKKIANGKIGYVLNKNDWGLGHVVLKEYHLHKADWDKNNLGN